MNEGLEQAGDLDDQENNEVEEDDDVADRPTFIPGGDELPFNPITGESTVDDTGVREVLPGSLKSESPTVEISGATDLEEVAAEILEDVNPDEIDNAVDSLDGLQPVEKGSLPPLDKLPSDDIGRISEELGVAVVAAASEGGKDVTPTKPANLLAGLDFSDLFGDDEEPTDVDEDLPGLDDTGMVFTQEMEDPLAPRVIEGAIPVEGITESDEPPSQMLTVPPPSRTVEAMIDVLRAERNRLLFELAGVEGEMDTFYRNMKVDDSTVVAMVMEGDFVTVERVVRVNTGFGRDAATVLLAEDKGVKIFVDNIGNFQRLGAEVLEYLDDNVELSFDQLTTIIRAVGRLDNPIFVFEETAERGEFIKLFIEKRKQLAEVKEVY